MLVLTNDATTIALRPARDGSDHFDVKCPGCKHSAYLHQSGDEGPQRVSAESVAAGDTIIMVCPQTDPLCGHTETFTVSEAA